MIPHGLCKVYKGKLSRLIEITVDVVTEHVYQYYIYISDPATENLFQLPYSLSSGDKIQFETSSLTRYVEYNIQLKETSVVTVDGTCTDYPYHNHETYADCVDDELRARILPSRGCMVPWMSSTDQCTEPIQRLPEQEDLLQWLYNIGMYSWGGISYPSAACPLPCTTLAAHSTFQFSGTGMSFNLIELYFEENIQVEKVRSIYISVLYKTLFFLFLQLAQILSLLLGKI